MCAGMSALGGGVVLWAAFGTLVYFDTLSASFLGCLF